MQFHHVAIERLIVGFDDGAIMHGRAPNPRRLKRIGKVTMNLLSHLDQRLAASNGKRFRAVRLFLFGMFGVDTDDLQSLEHLVLEFIQPRALGRL